MKFMCLCDIVQTFEIYQRLPTTPKSLKIRIALNKQFELNENYQGK